MIKRKSRPRTLSGELAQTQRLTRALQGFVALLGLALFASYFLLTDDNKGVLAESAYFLGTALVSASFVAFVVNRASVSENNLRTQQTIETSIERSLRSVTPPLLEHSVRDLRWSTVLEPAAENDPHPDYAVQHLHLSRVMRPTTDELRVICLASDLDEINSYRDDPRYVFRWGVDGSLDPNDRAIFEVVQFTVNGQPLKPRERLQATAKNTPCSDLGFDVPATGDVPVTIGLWVRLRKHLGSDERVRLRTQLFATTEGATFSCTVDPRLGFRRLYVTTGELTPLGPEGVTMVAPSADVSNGMLSINVQHDGLLQSGSAVAFHLERGAPALAETPRTPEDQIPNGPSHRLNG